MKSQWILASLYAALTIILGAFGAHYLKEILSEASMASYQTGVQYALFSILALYIIGLAGRDHLHRKQQKLIFRLLFIGNLLFSGSIYLLVINRIWNIGLNILGILTPIGGTMMISAFLLLAHFLFWNSRAKPTDLP